MGNEIRDPARTLPRSIYISAPLIAFVYICGTLAMLWQIPKSEINAVAGPLQAISAGMREAGAKWRWVAPFAAFLLTLARIGGLGAWLTGSARVAFVVGLDRYFPPAFARIHPRWRTPYIAIAVQAPIAAFFLLLSVLGKGTTVEKAFLILIDMSLLIYFIPFLYLFACFMAQSWKNRGNVATPLVVPGGAPATLIVGLCGVLITLFAMVVAMIPPAGTVNVWIHEAKLGGGALFLVLLGFLIYWRNRKLVSKTGHAS